ncbi:efflux RND transporter periplasmic adaptor subunit [Comamonas jiangduensis]|uniref:efflux RND transporter periplasmic adaptor subunit n=1 Tax=Comamonas jiangduensis TaxID=1194168 RepID=UPI003BF7793B
MNSKTEQQASPKPRRPRWLVLAAVVLVLAGVGYAALQQWRGPQVPAVQVQAQALVRSLQFSARVETNTRVGVGSTVVGRVESVAVNEGDAVQAGQLLLHLEQAELQAAAQQAQAGVLQAQAQLHNLRSTSRISIQAQVAQAQASLRQAQADWARNQQLVTQGFLSQAALDERRKALEVAQAQLQAAQAQAAASADGGAELKAAEAQVAQTQAALQAAQAKLAQTRIVAPRAGKVLRRAVEPGQIVQPGTVLLELALEGATLVVAQVDERFLDQLRERQSATVVPDAFADQRLAARVMSIAPGVDAQRGSIEVKLALDAPPPTFLREDMTVSVLVETGAEPQAVVLPLEALQPQRDGSIQVLVLKEGKATAQPVQVGLRTLEAAHIAQGVQVGDVVLLPPARAGQRVRPQWITHP